MLPGQEPGPRRKVPQELRHRPFASPRLDAPVLVWFGSGARPLSSPSRGSTPSRPVCRFSVFWGSLFPPLREGHPKMKKMEETRGWRTVGSEEEGIKINMEEGTGAIR